MPIVFRCDHCQWRYRMPAGRAGQLAECVRCGRPFRAPGTHPANTRGTVSGSSANSVPPVFSVLRSSDELELCDAARKIAEHAEENIGPIDAMIRDQSTHPVRTDIFRIPADYGRPFQTLVTCGMSAWPMSVPIEFRGAVSCYSELMMCLPADWPIHPESIDDERCYWPVGLLQSLAKLPFDNTTWLGPGHTVPNGFPAEPYAPGCRFSCALVAPPIAVESTFEMLRIDEEHQVRFYGIVPLYPEETTFKLRHGVESLLHRFDQHQVCEVFEPKRRNVCRPWWSVL